MRAPRLFAGAALALSGLGAGAAGCGGEPMPMPGFDGGPVISMLGAEQIIAYEGQTRFVTVIRGDATVDLTGAVITPMAADSALVVRETLCERTACGVVLEILDRTPSTGTPIPRPIDTRNDYLSVQAGDEERRVLITVWPLDAISNSGSPARVRGTIFASSATSAAAGLFQGMPGGEPVRWLVFGDATLAGDLEVSASDAEPGPGGGAGGAIGAAGEGASGGGAGGAGSGGGGGGGPGAAGTAGEGAAGGAGGTAASFACATDLAATDCGGGGGGGGASGAGGHGAGTLMIAVLGELRIDGELRATGSAGAAGAGGGGGGGGGAIVLAGATLSGAPSFDVSGGAGSGSGTPAEGAGGAGLVRVDSASSAPPGVVAGPAFDVVGADLMVSAATYVVRGRAAPGATVAIQAVDRASVSGTSTAAADGAFEVSITLEPGLNRLRVMVGAERGWNGTSFEAVREAGAPSPVPIGGVLDVAYVPAG